MRPPADPLLSVAGLWRDTVRVARAEAALVIPVAGAFLFLPQLLFAALRGTVDPAAVSGQGALGFGAIALLLFATSFGQAATTLVALDHEAGRARTLREIFAAAFAALPRVLGATLIAGLAIGIVAMLVYQLCAAAMAPPRAVATSLLIIALPLLWLLPRLVLIAPVALTEGVRPLAALHRAWAVARGRSGRLRIFLLLLLMFAALALVMGALVLGALATVLKLAFGAPLAAMVAQIGQAAIASVASVYLTVGYAIAYRHARVLEGPVAATPPPLPPGPRHGT